MADVLDVLSLPDAKSAISMDETNITHDVKLARHITAISRVLDDTCGPVVRRTVTAEIHEGGGRSVHLRRWPVYSITTVREVTSPGTIETLTAAAFGSVTDGYSALPWGRDPTLKSGALHRRKYGSDVAWTGGEQTVEVTYVAGRFATTSTVDARFADAAAAILRRLWKREAGAWSQSPTFFEDGDQQAGTGFFRVAKPIIEELLWDEMQTQLVGFA